MKYARIIEHTADIGIEVWGGTRKELFKNAGEAFANLICNRMKVRGREIYVLSFTAKNYEELLVTMLSELLYFHETENVVFHDIDFDKFTGNEIDLIIFGEPFDITRHEIRYAIKAVTYHDLSIRREPGRWIARIIFDI